MSFIDSHRQELGIEPICRELAHGTRRFVSWVSPTMPSRTEAERCQRHQTEMSANVLPQTKPPVVTR